MRSKVKYAPPVNLFHADHSLVGIGSLHGACSLELRWKGLALAFVRDPGVY